MENRPAWVKGVCFRVARDSFTGLHLISQADLAIDTPALLDAELASLFASAGDIPHLKARCSSRSIESEINIQPDGAEEGR